MFAFFTDIGCATAPSLSVYRALEEGVWDSGFRFPTYPGFRIQISHRVYSRFSFQITRIQISKRVGIQDSDFKWQGFRIQISKRVGIQDSDFKWQGFRIQIMSSRAILMQLCRETTPSWKWM